jgi:hypothetical protein
VLTSVGRLPWGCRRGTRGRALDLGPFGRRRMRSLFFDDSWILFLIMAIELVRSQVPSYTRIVKTRGHYG